MLKSIMSINLSVMKVSLSFIFFRMGRSTVCGILKDTCEAIWKVPMPQYIREPVSAAESTSAHHLWKLHGNSVIYAKLHNYYFHLHYYTIILIGNFASSELKVHINFIFSLVTSSILIKSVDSRSRVCVIWLW